MKKKLIRTRDGKIGGVCSGIAKYFDLDPTLVRVAFALVTVCTVFTGVLAYLVLWIVIPQENEEKGMNE